MLFDGDPMGSMPLVPVQVSVAYPNIVHNELEYKIFLELTGR
jgi:hypothetical protein